MRVFLVVAVVIGALAAQAQVEANAQGMFGGGGGGKRHHGQRSEAKAKPKQDEQVITPVPNNTPPAGPFDPWGNVRGSATPAAAKKPI